MFLDFIFTCLSYDGYNIILFLETENICSGEYSILKYLFKFITPKTVDSAVIFFSL